MTMADKAQPAFRGFLCCPDPTFAQVDELIHVKSLMTKEGLDFIKGKACNHHSFLASLGKEVRWDLAFIDAYGAMPGSAVCWFGKGSIGARVFLLLGKSTIAMYSGSESLEKAPNGFNLLQIEKQLLDSKVADRSVGRCEMSFDGALIAYDGRMAYELLEGRLYVFGFVPEAYSSHFDVGRRELVLPSSLREEAESLNTDNVKWLFRFDAEPNDL